MLTNNLPSILAKISSFDRPERIAWSRRFPFLTPLILQVRFAYRRFQNSKKPIARAKKTDLLPCTIARHQSLLLRRLGDSDPRLQRQKITNLQRAAEHLNGLVIMPGETFSLWETIGRPTAKRGFTKGMLLSNGQVVEGIGGGLCQVANLLHWLFLHSALTITERHHHSRDVFPDSGRVLPFGSGATIMYNFVDLQVKNTTDQPIQLSVWLTDKHLKGALRSSKPASAQYHVYEKEHAIVRESDRHFRYNELWREIILPNESARHELVTTNFAPILYAIDEAYCRDRNYAYLNATPAYAALNSTSLYATLGQDLTLTYEHSAG
jgi:vancomycin resistance protein VanW